MLSAPWRRTSPAARLRYIKKGALETYLFEVALSICSGGAFGFYSCKICCANKICDTDPHVLHVYLLIADKRFVPGTILVGPRLIRLLLTRAAYTMVSFTFFFLLKNVSKLVLRTLPN